MILLLLAMVTKLVLILWFRVFRVFVLVGIRFVSEKMFVGVLFSDPDDLKFRKMIRTDFLLGVLQITDECFAEWVLDRVCKKLDGFFKNKFNNLTQWYRKGI